AVSGGAAARATSSVVARIVTGGNPCGVGEGGGSVWVSDAERGELLRIDPATNTVVGRTKLDATPCELRLAAGAIWVVTQSRWLDRVDPATGDVIARIRVGATTYDVAFAFGSIWVTNWQGGTIQRVNPATNRVEKTIRFHGSSPGGIAA